MTINLPKYFTRKQTQICGVYFLIRKNKIIYIGKSNDVFTRVFITNDARRAKKFDLVRIIPCSAEKLGHYERRWIIRFRPKYNRAYLFTWRGSHVSKKTKHPINMELARNSKKIIIAKKLFIEVI